MSFTLYPSPPFPFSLNPPLPFSPLSTSFFSFFIAPSTFDFSFSSLTPPFPFPLPPPFPFLPFSLPFPFPLLLPPTPLPSFSPPFPSSYSPVASFAVPPSPVELVSRIGTDRDAGEVIWNKKSIINYVFVGSMFCLTSYV